MSDEFLSQEEIDALLGVDNESTSTETLEEGKEKPFDFSQVEHIKKGGLPGLELIFERWIKIFRDEIRKLIPNLNMISKEDMYITRFQSFMLKIPLPASYSIFTMKPLKENALMVLDSRLVFTIISVLFGGPPKPFKVEGREFTKLEARVIRDIVGKSLKVFESIWTNIYPINIELKSIELNPTLARIVSQNEKVVIVELSMDIDGYTAPFYFCFPQSMFLPIKDIIYTEVANTEKDPVWEKNLEAKILHLNVKLWVELIRKEYKIKDILEWEEGTKLEFDVLNTDLLKIFIENKPKFLGKLGQKGNKFAVKIKDLIINEEE
ncbi:MAG TPA: flagellar motor switch protein FliM [Persephonella sp.]|nr:flagellar motor switch protein FliM [Hydrogenothermaceae bacterium]HIQ25031.1 flagellar motor switch protein FliM [Persephonella sp.]